MSRLSTKYWMQNLPLSIQIWVELSLLSALSVLLVSLAALLLLPHAGSGAQRLRLVTELLLSLMILDIFIAKLVARRITEPFERLAETLAKVRGKNWDSKIVQVARRDEIGQIINTLSQIQRNVVEINEDEELFYQSVSHGLKTPIMVIQNCCAAYHDGIYGDEAIDIIMKESLALESSIKKLLYVSSFDHMLGKRSEFTQVPLYQCAQTCQRRFLGNERKIQLLNNVPEHCTVLGNSETLQTVFDNIVENGLRYAESYICISCQEEGEFCHLIFENDGAPIPPQILNVLFEKFYKGSSGNFGLGLYIARKIVQFHGGEIWADNWERGVRFHLLLKK